MRYRILTLFLFAALVMGATAARAATYYVNNDGNDANAGTQTAPFKTIQRGINAAANGDTVWVGDGFYIGSDNTNLLFNGKSFTLKSQGGAENCRIDCLGVGRAFQFSAGSTAQMVVEGFAVENGIITASNGGGTGGAAIIVGSNPTFRNCTFFRNRAEKASSARGGAIYLQTSNAVFENCLFRRNRVIATVGDAEGGAIHVTADSSLTLRGCEFFQNTVSAAELGDGGALMFRGTGTLSDCTFEDNAVSTTSPEASRSSGGAIALRNTSSQATLIRCRLLRNCVEGAKDALGGGVLAHGGTLTLTDCTLSQNTAVAANRFASGGGIALFYNIGVVTLRNVVCSENTVTTSNDAAYGGGLYIVESPVSATNCQFLRNSASALGMEFQNSALGGGIYIRKFGFDQDYATALLLTNCVVAGNKCVAANAVTNGGGIFTQRSRFVLINTLLVNNSVSSPTSASGGGLYAYQPSDASLLTHCTVTGNAAMHPQNQEYGGGISMARDGIPEGQVIPLTNCIVRENTAAVGANLRASNAAVIAVTYSCIGDYPAAPDADNNFGADPLFVRNASAGADGILGTADDDFGDLRLQAGSPVINAGTAAAPNLLPYDLVGLNRTAGAAPDIGAYEFGSTPLFLADFYVDKAAGSDTAGTGTAAAPFQTVAKALASLNSPAFTKIYIKAGNYGTDKPRTPSRVRFVNWTNTGRAAIGKP